MRCGAWVATEQPRRRRWRWVLAGAVLAVLLGIVLAASQQHRLIYYPRRYAPDVLDHLPPGVAALPYCTSQGVQVSFYQAPADGGEPQRLWLMCSGQGNLALEMSGLVAEVPDRSAGFLFLDYPGFGLCEGTPSPGRILDASTAAVEALRQRLGWSAERMAERLGVFGYSLGTGVAMQHAAAHPVRAVVLAAPYTSLADMADLMFFPPCGWFVWHRFDSAANLALIAKREPRPAVSLWHGGRDDTIPVAMSAQLAGPYPGWVEAHVVAGADHNTIILDALAGLAAP